MNIRLYIIGIIAIFILAGGYLYLKKQTTKNNTSSTTILPSQAAQNTSSANDAPVTTVIAENLDTPWGIAFLPDKSMLVTERPGRVRFVDSNGKLREKPVATFDQVKEIGEGGLLGITIDPKFSENGFVYFYYTYEENGEMYNRVERYQYSVIKLGVACPQNNPNCDAATARLTKDKIIIDKIPSSSNHNGGRIKFGPDNNLYITTGDSQNPSLAQDKSSLAGKILRVQVDAEVYSYGHRNAQGLAWDNKGQLWATEHGRSGLQSGLDELNFIEEGKNYGWPIIQGDEKKEGMETPRLNSGSDTWAPAGAAFVDNLLFFGGLRGQALYRATINGKQITLKEYFKKEFGRIRDVVRGPDGMLYITTSNRDGRGKPQSNDDKVIKVNPKKL